MSRQQARLLRFLIKYSGWQTIGPDARRTARNLAAHGLVEWRADTNCARIVRRFNEEETEK